MRRGECRVDRVTEKDKDMKKKITVLTLCTVLLALCVSAEAQQKSKIAKIGWLAARPPSGPTGVVPRRVAQTRLRGRETVHF